jgi:hypothetical protein
MGKKIAIALFVLFCMTAAFAGDDPSIKGQTRAGIQKAMQQHVNDNTVNGVYAIYDGATDDVKFLQFKKLHRGIVKKGGFYVSCSDFADSEGTSYCVDLLAAEENGKFRVVDSIVHKTGNQKRSYHLISSQVSPGWHYDHCDD